MKIFVEYLTIYVFLSPTIFIIKFSCNFKDDILHLDFSVEAFPSLGVSNTVESGVFLMESYCF